MKKIIAATIGGLGLALIVPQVAQSAVAHHTTEPTYTLAQVAPHNTAADCWSVVAGGVYNLTAWLPSHPEFAGSVAAICGVDATRTLIRSGHPSHPVVLGHPTDDSVGRPADSGDDDAQGNDDRQHRAAVTAKAVHPLHRQGRGHLLKSIRPFRIGRLAPVAANPTPTPPVAAPVPAPTVTPPASAAVVTYTLAQVATHATITNCWTAIGGNVYNLSDWASTHPGGAAALVSFICGKDGTAAFAHQHGGGSKPASILAARKIGVLAG